MLELNPKTPRHLRITLFIFVYLCEFLSICVQTWLFLDIDFETISTDFKLNMRREYLLIFSISMFGSVLNAFSTIVPLNCIANLQNMVETQENKKREREEKIADMEEEEKQRNAEMEDDDEA